jgi:hypothetical protein
MPNGYLPGGYAGDGYPLPSLSTTRLAGTKNAKKGKEKRKAMLDRSRNPESERAVFRTYAPW